jgi:hypothetical protein
MAAAAPRNPDTPSGVSHARCAYPVESTLRAARERMEDDARIPPAEPGDAATVDLARFRASRALRRRLAVLDALEQAIGRRDAIAVWDIIDDPEMLRALPREVREEAIVSVHLPPRVHRAPIHLYRHQHRLAQLGDEPFITPMDDGTPTGTADVSDTRALEFPHARGVSRPRRSSGSPTGEAR